LTVVAVIILSVAGYIVTSPNIFVYLKPGFSQIKSEISTNPFDLPVKFKILKQNFGLLGTVNLLLGQ
jgi:hypothetical protein